MNIRTSFIALATISLLVPLAGAQTSGTQTGQTQATTASRTATTTQIKQQAQPNAARSAVPVAQAAAPLRKLGFRVTDWKTIHSKSAAEAQEDITTLKKIGCEVVSSDHGNHIDVKYRCPEWKSIKLATPDLVTQWSQWCKTKGMETVIMNPPATTKNPTVRFRLASIRKVHLHNPTDAAKIVNTLNLVGCQVTTQAHNGHTDATFSCPQWLTIELETEESAHAWQKWFNDSGFETQHTHVK